MLFTEQEDMLEGKGEEFNLEKGKSGILLSQVGFGTYYCGPQV